MDQIEKTTASVTPSPDASTFNPFQCQRGSMLRVPRVVEVAAENILWWAGCLTTGFFWSLEKLCWLLRRATEVFFKTVFNIEVAP